MWTIFKIINIFWILATTNMWPTAIYSSPYLPVLVNILMIIVLGLMQIKIRFGFYEGKILLAIVGLGIWSIITDSVGLSVTVICSCLPVLYLTQLPYSYLKDLLAFTTKWYAILLIPGLIIYWITIFIPLPDFGTLVHPNYVPYTNYIFYIKTTFDTGFLVRFNAFFLEPGHLALCSTFLIFVNQYRFRSCPWLWILLISIVFSFSLAGYLLVTFGFILISINSIPKLVVSIALGTALVAGVLNWDGGDNTLNNLILSRLEYDESSGIKGNNRFFDDTDYQFKKASGTKYIWISVKGRANMDLISGAGYKIYVLQYGLIGVILVVLFYLSIIPPRPNVRFTVSILILFTLCFLQRAYPLWYSWLFPYVVGLYLTKGEKDENELLLEENPDSHQIQ